MGSKAFENEFLKNLSLLNKEQQEKVLAYIRSLLKSDQHPHPNELLQFAGTIDPKSLQEMSVAIEVDCENIDKNEW